MASGLNSAVTLKGNPGMSLPSNLRRPGQHGMHVSAQNDTGRAPFRGGGSVWRMAAFWAVAVFCVPTLLPASVLEGRLELKEKGRDRTKQEARFAVIYFEPEGGVAPSALARAKPSDVATITMTKKQFVPRILPVLKGSKVDFPNNDGILHNVFSLSGKNRFDLGLYRRGKSRQTVLDHPGVVQIFCNVHHSMVAYILVLDTPHFTMPDRDGSFRLENLPPGPGKLVAWHERSEPSTLVLKSSNQSSLRLALDITKPRVPHHRNKFGKPYSRKRRGKAY